MPCCQHGVCEGLDSETLSHTSRRSRTRATRCQVDRQQPAERNNPPNERRRRSRRGEAARHRARARGRRATSRAGVPRLM
eukprot:COSAG02_NODE_389_length_23251_cov_259.067640_5_plen_80_part_00